MKTFVQYGAGNIGRGFIGQLFSKSGFAVKFIDVNMEVINALNSEKKYPVNVVSKDGSTEIWTENVSGIDGTDINAVVEAIANCDIMATAIGVNILPRIVPNLVAGFRKRIEIGNEKPLNIIICENLLDADKILYKLMCDLLTEEEKEIFNQKVGLIEASIGRMVPVMTEEMRQGNVLRVCVESYSELPVDKDAFKGEIPEVSNMHPFSPFGYYIKRKLFIHNMGHALSSYLGNLLGCEYIWQAMNNPYVKLIVSRAMQESAVALSKAYGIPLSDIQDNINDLLLRFSNIALGDTVERVGKDTLRKLSANDRFAGAIKFCEEEGVEPTYISIGIAVGLLFSCENDTGTKTVNDKLKESGINSVLNDICGISDKNSSFTYIKDYFQQLTCNNKLDALLALAESNQEKILKIKKVI